AGTLDYSPEVLVVGGGAREIFVAAPYPNPFNPITTMRLAVARAQHVRADVFDATGRRVATLIDEDFPADVTRTIEFDGSNLAPGLYLIRIDGDHIRRTEKVLLVK
ncbi:MAG: T9SS type A sorting domain-containing protein, partial [Rhodothermales bacterium]|nr:T9SS type A sorting domain-containing protein [Rhodothermales bacterium]